MMKKPPAPVNHLPKPRYGFDQYREIAFEFFKAMFEHHYTDFVITDDSKVSDYSHICIEGYEHEYSSLEELEQAADRILAQRIKRKYNLYLESLEIPLYTLFEQIRNQQVLH
jgi:hypothetical protein